MNETTENRASIEVAGQVEPLVRCPPLEYCYGDEGTTFFARGDIDDAVFLNALRKEVDLDDPILSKPVQHGFMRYTPDPERVYPQLLVFGVARKQGAWRATWISSNT